MSAARPREVTHRGRVAAAGFVIDLDLVSVAEARRRLLRMWQCNAKAYRLENTLLIVLPEAMPVRAETAPGAPLVRQHDVLAACPLPRIETTAHAGTIALVRGGELVYERPADLTDEAVDEWIETDGLRFEQGSSLGGDPVRPVSSRLMESRTIGESLAEVPKAAPERDALLSRLKSVAGSEATVESGGVLSLIRRLLPSGARSGAPPSRQSKATSRGALPQKPFVERLLAWTGIAQRLGVRQARYLSRTMQMFERGDLEEGLRHAIPLSSFSGPAASKTTFGLPAARRDLHITPLRGPTSSMYFGSFFHAELERLYRDTFRRLEAQGKIEQAAFVLAELLLQNEEAVAFLERHGRLKQAAEIAEARGLSPDLIVRQWYIAGDRKRAIQIARKTGAFHGALSRLAASNPDLASEIRRDWAATLVEAGSPAAAVEVLWPAVSHRSEAIALMKQAVEFGGLAGARNLARLAGWSPEEFNSYREHCLNLLSSDAAEDSILRAEFASALTLQPTSPQTRTLARAAARAVIRDAGRGLETLPRGALLRVVGYSEDGALRADTPDTSARRTARLRDLKSPRRQVVEAAGLGDTVVVSDVAPLAGGGYAIAYGDAGVELLRRDGRGIRRLEAPADRLVVSESGTRLIAIAWRGRTSMLSKVDASSRRSASWCLAELQAFASSFDGGTWYVATDGDIYAIDAMSDSLSALWRIPDVGVPAGPLLLTQSWLSFVTYQQQALWTWLYSIPDMRLAAKFKIQPPAAPDLLQAYHLGSNGLVLFAFQSKVLVGPSWMELFSLQKTESLLTSIVTGEWIANVVTDGESSRVLLHSNETKRPPVLRLEIHVKGVASPILRLTDFALIIAGNGYLHHYELTYGSRIARLRLQV